MAERELPPDPWYIDKVEMARRLGVSVPTVNRLMAMKVISVYRIKGTRMVRFHVDEVDALVEMQKESDWPKRRDVDRATG